MKKQKEEITKKEKKHRKYDKGEIFIKVMAGILAVMMLGASTITIIFALMG